MPPVGIRVHRWGPLALLLLAVPGASAAQPAVPPAAAPAPPEAPEPSAAPEAPPPAVVQPPQELPPSGTAGQGKEKPGKVLDLKEEIVVTANRIPVEAETVGSAVTIIGRDEIELRQEPLVLDLLRTVPGLEVNQTGGPGGLANVFIRGGDPTQALVLIDGVPVNNATGGGFDFSSLGSDNIERIEILRGPQSTLYGSAAIGGVISIITQRGSPGFHADLDARDGSRNGRQLRAAVDGAAGGLDYSVSAAGQGTDGPSEAGEKQGNPASDSSQSARLGFALPAGGRVDLTMRHLEARANLDGFIPGVGTYDAPNFIQHRQLSLGSLQVSQPVGGICTLHFTAGIASEQTHASDPDNAFNDYDFRSGHGDLAVQSDFKLGKSNTLIAGLSEDDRHAFNVGAYRQSLHLGSAYLQDSWSLHDRLFLNAGARYDQCSRFGNRTTYRLTASDLGLESWRFHGSFGTGFRAPALDELFFPQAGNPNLRPETSEGADVGVERELLHGLLAGDLTLFENQFRDLIDFDFTTGTFANDRRATAQGIEAALRLRPRSGLEIQGSYTYTHSKDLATGLPLARRPRDRWTVVAAYDPGQRLRASLSLVAVDHRIDSDGTPLDSYQRVDLAVEYRARPWLAPYLLIQNLLDQRYEEIRGYTTPRLWAFVGFRLRYT